MDPRLRAAIERQRAAHERRLEAITQLEERIGAEVDDTDEARAAAETARTDAQTAFQAADDEFQAASRDVTDLEQLAQARAQMPRELTREAQLRGADIRVGEEPLTYRRGGEHSFIRDAYLASGMGGAPAPVAVLERIQRHQVEHAALVAAAQERAASDTTNFAGLVVPQFLTDLVAPLARAGRPLANIAAHHDLPPDGMEVDISRITTGTSADVQNGEGTQFSSTAIDDTLLTVPVRTIGGFNDISIQAVLRGTGAEAILVQDLLRAWHTRLDLQVANGSGAAGQLLGILQTAGIGAVSYVDATPTVGEAYPKFADAQQRINAGLFANMSHWVMHPRRLGWLLAAVDSQNRPLVVPIAGGNAAMNAIGTGDGPTSYGNSGYQLLGSPIVTDGNIPITLGGGTEDAILAVDANELHLWEDPSMPMMMRFEQPVGHQGQVRIVVFGFAAFTAGRYPVATSAITGTGLAAPTF